MLWSNTPRLTRDRKKWLIVRYMLWQYLSFLYLDFLTGIWSLGWIMVQLLHHQVSFNSSRFGHEPSLLPREYQKPGYVSVWDPHTENTATTLRESNEAPPDFEKNVMEGTRHCHQPSKQFELPSIKIETQNLVTYYNVQNCEQ